MSVSLSTQPRQALPGGAASVTSPLGWPSPDDAEFDMAGMVLRFTADRRIYEESDEARCFYKVINGTVRSCQFLNDGRRQIDAFYQQGDFFGFEAGNVHRLAAEAVTDCTIVAYRRRGLEGLIVRDDRLSRWFFGQVLNTMARAREHGLLLGRGSAAQKVAAFLLEMAERVDDGAIVDLPMGRQDIADYLGLTIETVSRSLSHMERDKTIGLPAPRRVELRNLPALRALNN